MKLGVHMLAGDRSITSTLRPRSSTSRSRSSPLGMVSREGFWRLLRSTRLIATISNSWADGDSRDCFDVRIPDRARRPARGCGCDCHNKFRRCQFASFFENPAPQPPAAGSAPLFRTLLRLIASVLPAFGEENQLAQTVSGLTRGLRFATMPRTAGEKAWLRIRIRPSAIGDSTAWSLRG